MSNPRSTESSRNQDESFADWYAYEGHGLQDSDKDRTETVSPPPAVRAQKDSAFLLRSDSLAYEMSHVPSTQRIHISETPLTPHSHQSPGHLESFESDHGLSVGSQPISRTRSEGTATSEAPLRGGFGQEKSFAYPSAASTPASFEPPDGFNYRRPPFSRNSSAGWTHIAPTEAEDHGRKLPGHSRLASESRPNLEFAEGDFVSCLPIAHLTTRHY
jgi:hypothetical protein